MLEELRSQILSEKTSELEIEAMISLTENADVKEAMLQTILNVSSADDVVVTPEDEKELEELLKKVPEADDSLPLDSKDFKAAEKVSSVAIDETAFGSFEEFAELPSEDEYGEI